MNFNNTAYKITNERGNGMIYCTSCGEVCKKKVCKICGVKKGAQHKFCGWCKSEINEGAAICLECNEAVSPTIVDRVKKVIDIAMMIIVLIVSFGVFTSSVDYSYIYALIMVGVALINLPYVRVLIRKKH